MTVGFRWQAAALAAFAVGWLGCGGDKSTGPDSSGPVNIPFSSQSSSCAGYAPGVIHVTQLLGPRGASTSNVLPGVWMARGTFALGGTAYTSAEIRIGFVGSVVVAEGANSVPQSPHVVTAANLSGSFEATGGFIRLEAGPGTPVVMISSGSSALDCVTLH